MKKTTILTVAVLGLTALVSAAPATLAQPGAETDIVTFYGHMFSHGITAPMPANTQYPVGEDNYGLGSLGTCTSAVPYTRDPTGEVGDVGGSCAEDAGFNQVALFSSAGFVDVNSREEFQQSGSYRLFHNERGQTKDILLDKSKPIQASIYFSMDFHGWPVSTVNDEGTLCIHPHPRDVPCVNPYWGWDPGVVPNVVVDAKLYMANLGDHGSSASDAPPIQEAIQSGSAQVIAQGKWGPGQVMNGLPGSPNVNRFDIDLGAPTIDTIPRTQDFFLVYTVYVDGGAADAEAGRIRFWSGEFFPPSFTLPVKNALDVERVIPTFAHGKLAILGVINTPWGSYDVSRVQLTIEDSTGREIEPGHIQRFGSFSVGHGGHYVPINFTWVWNYNADGLKPGTYTARVTAQNYQGSASATCESQFVIKPPRAEGALPTGGAITEGVCGQQTASDDQLAGLQQGASEQTTSAGPRAEEPVPIVPAPPAVRLHGATVERADAPFLPILFIPALAGMVLLRRRWTE